MSAPSILTNVRDGVAEVVLNRPDRLNALDEPLCAELEAALSSLGADRGVRALLLRGEGRSFCAGGDVKRMKELLESGSPAGFFEGPLAAINRAVVALASFPGPVVAALQGAVAGGGFNLALAADIRIASSEARFNQAFVRLGLVPDMGGTLSLPSLCGLSRAAELCYTGDFIDATTACSWGIVNRVVAPDRLVEESRSFASRLAAGPAEAIARTKRLLRRGWVAALAEQAELERRAQVEAGSGEEFAEGIRAFFEKRAPSFLAPPSPRTRGDETNG